MTRKHWFHAILMAAAILSKLLSASVAHAAAPQVKTSAPGYFRMMLGDFEITALPNGTVHLPVDKLLTNTSPGKVELALSKSFLKAPVETSVNAYLINTGSQLVLVDAGAAGLYSPTLGKLMDNLKAAGYQPDQVDAVLITHMHPDHVGGLTAGTERAFPNATVYADKHDADYWFSPANAEKAPDWAKGFFQGAMSSLKPYVAADKFKTFEGITPIVPGVRAQPSPGHTPGHNTYVVESKGQTLVLWGDLMHVAAVQFHDPSTTIRSDVDSKAAIAERKKAYADAAEQGYWVGAAHLSFPGIGHLRREGKGHVFVPANYTVVRP